MAKLIPYQPDRTRKPGFRKVKQVGDVAERQLDLFDMDNDTRVIRQIDPFQKGLQVDENDDALAEKFYMEATKRDDSAADAYCNLGIIYARQGQTSQAIDCFTQALIKEPRHAIAHYNLGNMYYDAGNFKLSQIHYEVAGKMEDVFPEIFYNLFLTYLALEEHQMALSTLEKYIEKADETDAVQARKLLKVLQL